MVILKLITTLHPRRNGRRPSSFLRLCSTRARRGRAARDGEQRRIWWLGGTTAARGGSNQRGGGEGVTSRGGGRWEAVARARDRGGFWWLGNGMGSSPAGSPATARVALLLGQVASSGTAPIDRVACGSSWGWRQLNFGEKFGEDR
jgi:hypothetical protein